MIGFQKLNTVPGVSTFMHTVGHIGTGEVLVTFFALLYWCLDSDLCVTGIWLVPVAEITNGLIKWQFQQPRPGWVDREIDIRSASHEYSFPSSHSMIICSLAAFFTAVRPSTGWLAIVVAVLVCVSRVFEGAHYPKDVLVGALLGSTLGLTHSKVYPMVLDLLDEHLPSVAGRITVGLVGTLLVYMLVERYYADVSGTRVPSTWNTRNGLSHGAKLDPFYVPYCNYVAMYVCCWITWISVSSRTWMSCALACEEQLNALSVCNEERWWSVFDLQLHAHSYAWLNCCW